MFAKALSGVLSSASPPLQSTRTWHIDVEVSSDKGTQRAHLSDKAIIREKDPPLVGRLLCDVDSGPSREHNPDTSPINHHVYPPGALQSHEYIEL